VIFYDYYQHNILPLVDLKRPLNAIPLCPTRTVLQQMQQQHGYKHINWHAFRNFLQTAFIWITSICGDWHYSTM